MDYHLSSTEIRTFNDHILHRIYYDDGIIGGWVESEDNILGSNTKILDESKVYGSSRISSFVTVVDESIVCNSSLNPFSYVEKSSIANSTIHEYTEVRESNVSYAKINNRSRIYNSNIINSYIGKFNTINHCNMIDKNTNDGFNNHGTTQIQIGNVSGNGSVKQKQISKSDDDKYSENKYWLFLAICIPFICISLLITVLVLSRIW